MRVRPTGRDRPRDARAVSRFWRRHLDNTSRTAEAEPDYLLARYLFPRNRQLYIAQNQISVQCSAGLFEPGEKGHPTELASWLQRLVRLAPWSRKDLQSPRCTAKKPQENRNGNHVQTLFQQIFVADLPLSRTFLENGSLLGFAGGDTN